MSKFVSKREKLRSSSKTYVEDSRNIFRDAYTIEPMQVGAAWDTFSVDTFAIEVAMYPKLLHDAFVFEMKKRVKHAS